MTLIVGNPITKELLVDRIVVETKPFNAPVVHFATKIQSKITITEDRTMAMVFDNTERGFLIPVIKRYITEMELGVKEAGKNISETIENAEHFEVYVLTKRGVYVVSKSKSGKFGITLGDYPLMNVEIDYRVREMLKTLPTEKIFQSLIETQNLFSTITFDRVTAKDLVLIKKSKRVKS